MPSVDELERTASLTLPSLDNPDMTHDNAALRWNRAALQALVAMASVVPKSAVPRIAKFQEHRLTELGLYAHELIGKILALERPTLEQLRTMTAIEWRKAPDQGYAVFASIASVASLSSSRPRRRPQCPCVV